MSTHSNWIVWITVTLALTGGVGLWMWNGRAPSMEARDNRRTVDALLTAITMKNSRLLEAGVQRARTRREAALLTEDQYAGMVSFASKARAGDWAGAEKAGYAFRQKYPFVKEGQ